MFQLNFAYWVRGDFATSGLTEPRKLTLLSDILTVWRTKHPDIELFGSDELQARLRIDANT